MQVEGIILAAGFSRRAGAFKMELPFGEKRLIQQVVEGMRQSCPRIIVVGGFKIERVIEMVNIYPEVRVVLNKEYERGMFGSVQEGVRHVTGDLFFIMPGDHPLITTDIYRDLIHGLMSAGPAYDIAVPVYKDRKGHPVLLRKKTAEELLKEPIDSTLKKFIQRKGFAPVNVDKDCILKDVDTMEDYKKAAVAFRETIESG